MRPKPKNMKKTHMVKKSQGDKKTGKAMQFGEFDNDDSGDDDDVYGQKMDMEEEGAVLKWFEEFAELPECNLLDATASNALRREAAGLFEREVAANANKQPKGIPQSDYLWMKTVIHKGTTNDKIAAYALLIQDNAVLNLAHLKNLVSMIKVGKKRECFMAMDTLVELFLDNLLPPDRKLSVFTQKPLSKVSEISGGDSERRCRLLVLWFFEEQLKTLYTAFLGALNDAAHDTVDANKERSIVVMSKLLRGHPEQEATLLANIVNKLGDPSHKIGSKVIYTLTQLLDAHPAMKSVVMEEVEKVIFRPNMSKRAQYYSVCFLSQFSLDSSDDKLANSLIPVYFALFKACIKTGEIDSRMMGALLTGVSRAYPYAQSDSTALKQNIDTIYKVVHLSSANVAIQALSLLFLVVGDTLPQRFMTVLYKKIGDPGMFQAAHHAMFMSLIFKTLKRDPNNSRVCAFIKRLLQVCIHLAVPLICGLLMLISQVIHGRKDFKLKMEAESQVYVKLEDDDDDDDGDEFYKDATDDKKEVPIEVPERKPSSWVHANLKKPVQNVPDGHYNPYKRNPEHAEGDTALLIELVELSRHFHPTVSLFASNILEGSKISYSGDPLQDFTLIRFLDKFVFKNPKQINPNSQQLTTFTRFGRKKFYSSVGLKRLPANSSQYLSSEQNVIPVDETYLYKYLKQKEADDLQYKEIKKSTEDEDNDGSDVDSVSDGEFDSILNEVSAGERTNLDFMEEIGNLSEKSLDKKGKRGLEESDSSDEEGSEGPDEGSDEEGDEDDFGSEAEDFDGDELDDMDEDDELLSSDNESPTVNNGRKKFKNQKPKSSGLFASAEKFAELLENNDHYNSGGFNAVSRKDNAAVKQLAWESKRENRYRNQNRGKHHQPSTSGNKNKTFARNKGRQHNVKSHKKKKMS